MVDGTLQESIRSAMLLFAVILIVGFYEIGGF